MASTQKFILDPGWSITQSGQALIISGGADARYEIELEDTGPSFFSQAQATKPFTRSTLSPYDQNVLEQLITAEIVKPVLQKSSRLKVRMLGDTTLPLRSTAHVTVADTGYDLGIIIRSQSTYAGLLEKTDYVNVSKPHLFVDIAFNHTISIGPLVFPGETACIACLQGRIGKRWGDETPPPQPKAAVNWQELAAELVMAELLSIAQGSVSLTNKTVSWNIQDRDIAVNQLLKVPLCPICTQNAIDPSGALVLPWTQR